MKSLIKYSMAIVTIYTIVSCSKDENQTTSLTGSWKVSSLIIDGTDMTSQCKQFTVTFNGDGTMNVCDSLSTWACSWIEHSGMMSSSMMAYHFDMHGCPDDSPMQYLENDWLLIETDNQIATFKDGGSQNCSLILTRI